MTSTPLPAPPIKPPEAVREKFTVVAGEHGEWIWAKRPTPEQDAAWITSQHQYRDAFLSLAKRESKLSVQYRRWALEETSPDRAARYAAEALRLRRKSKTSLHAARMRNV